MLHFGGGCRSKSTADSWPLCPLHLEGIPPPIAALQHRGEEIARCCPGAERGVEHQHPSIHGVSPSSTGATTRNHRDGTLHSYIIDAALRSAMRMYRVERTCIEPIVR